MRRFLTFIVEEALAGRAGYICEYSIGVSVFDRAISFEPGLDPIVRNDARRLRQKLLEYYQAPSRPEEIVIEVPKGGYVPVFRPSRQEKLGSEARYRLSISLTSLEDGRQLWATERTVEGIQNLGLDLEVPRGALLSA